MSGKSRPYEILRIGSTASVSEVVQRSQQLIQETTDEKRRREYRRAAAEIRQHPVHRAVCQFWEPPGTNYENTVVDSFCREYGPPPLKARWLYERRDAFVEQLRSTPRLAYLVLPEVCVPEPYSRCRLKGVPQDTLQLPLELWEILPV